MEEPSWRGITTAEPLTFGNCQFVLARAAAAVDAAGSSRAMGDVTVK